MWQDAYLNANGIRLHYYRTGGAKPPLVLAHGFTDNALCWTPVIRVLEADYDVVMYDARGHGLSDGPEHGYSEDHHADDLAGLVQALKLDKPSVLGHSMGARTAALTAARYPGLLRAVLLEDPPFFADWATRADAAQHLQKQEDDSEAEVPFEHWLLPLRQYTTAELIARQRTENPHWPDEEYEPWAQSKLQFNTGILEQMRRREVPPPPPWKEIIEPITCPILLITGDTGQGALVTPELANELLQTAANVRVAHISEAGHSIRRDQFTHYIEVVRAFLAEVYAL